MREYALSNVDGSFKQDILKMRHERIEKQIKGPDMADPTHGNLAADAAAYLEKSAGANESLGGISEEIEFWKRLSARERNLRR